MSLTWQDGSLTIPLATSNCDFFKFLFFCSCVGVDRPSGHDIYVPSLYSHPVDASANADCLDLGDDDSMSFPPPRPPPPSNQHQERRGRRDDYAEYNGLYVPPPPPPPEDEEDGFGPPPPRPPPPHSGGRAARYQYPADMGHLV